MNARHILPTFLLTLASSIACSEVALAGPFPPIERKISTFSIRVTNKGYEHFGPGQTVPPTSLPATIIAISGRSSNEIWMLTDSGVVLRDDGKTITFRQANPCGFAKEQKGYAGHGHHLHNLMVDKDFVHVFGEFRGIDARVGTEVRASLAQNGKWKCTTEQLTPDLIQSANGIVWKAANNMDTDSCRIASLSGFCTSGPRFSPTHIDPVRDTVDMGIYNRALWMHGNDDGWVVTSDETFHQTLNRFNGVTWTRVAKIPEGHRISSIWGDERRHLWLTARSGSNWDSPAETIYRFDGISLKPLALPGAIQTRLVQGTSSNDVWFSGHGETIYHWDGTKLREGKAPAPVTSMWVAPDGGIFFVLPETVAFIAPAGGPR